MRHKSTIWGGTAGALWGSCCLLVTVLAQGCLWRPHDVAVHEAAPSYGSEAAVSDSAPLQILGTPLYQAGVISRSISAENPTGAPGAGGQAKGGRKGAPFAHLERDEVFEFARIEGPGVIRHIWLTLPVEGPEKQRNLILRFYWDDQAQPSVEVPLSDFFGVSHGRVRAFESAFITTAEGRSFNCYFPMPFARNARLTLCNETGRDVGLFFYQVDYTLGDHVDQDTPLFHAQFRRVLDTTLKEDYVILDGVRGRGRYLGATLGLVDRYRETPTWWGEGEVKIYLDGDTEFPTICGTGTEDYVLAGWGLGAFSNMESGAPLVERKFISYYRFHGRDPIYFGEDIKVTLQQMGHNGDRSEKEMQRDFGRAMEKGWIAPGSNEVLYERVDDVCSTAYWYQTLPTQSFPPFPSREVRTHDLDDDPPNAQ